MPLQKSGRATGYEHWTTPTSFLDLVWQIGPIGLDPCSNFASNTNALAEFWGPISNGSTITHLELAKANWRNPRLVDGLTTSWRGNTSSLTFVNPPYNKMSVWTEKMVTEAFYGVEIVTLVPARMSPKWMHRMLNTADACCFWGPGRIQFNNPPAQHSTSSIENFIAYYGPNQTRFLEVFATKGKCMRLK